MTKAFLFVSKRHQITLVIYCKTMEKLNTIFSVITFHYAAIDSLANRNPTV